jgi:cell division cycle 2-like protein
MSSTNARKSKWESDESDSEANDHSSKRLKQSKKSKVGNTSSHSRHDARNTEAQTSQPTTSSDIVTEEDTATSMPISPVRRVVAKPVNPPIPTLHSCRHVDNYEKLNRIEEGAYGVVFRARDRKTGDIVALKKFKLEKEKNGFPITSLREIRTLMLAKHPNIVNIREIVVGDKFDQLSLLCYLNYCYD